MRLAAARADSIVWLGRTGLLMRFTIAGFVPGLTRRLPLAICWIIDWCLMFSGYCSVGQSGSFETSRRTFYVGNPLLDRHPLLAGLRAATTRPGPI
jgi:hypothetical protein